MGGGIGADREIVSAALDPDPISRYLKYVGYARSASGQSRRQD